MQSNLLKSELALAGINQSQLANLMDKQGTKIDRATLNGRINGRTEFKQSEMLAIIKALHLSDEKAMQIFFTSNVS